MSSRSWHNHLIKAFPEWTVEDYAGNNFAMYKDFETKTGARVLVGVGEYGAFSFKHPEKGRLVSTQEYLDMSEAAYEKGGDQPFDSSDLYVSFIHRNENSQKQEEQPELLAMFGEETALILSGFIEEFIEQYWIGGGHKKAV